MFFPVVNDVGVKIVRKARAGADRQAGDDGEDGGKRDRADKREELATSAFASRGAIMFSTLISSWRRMGRPRQGRSHT